MRKIKLILFIIIIAGKVTSQTPSWHTLPNAPQGGAAGRFEDMYFVNSLTGWIVNYEGPVYKTTDGGNSWIFLDSLLNPALRSTGFFDANSGIIGTLDSNHVLFRTSNGGSAWTLDTAYTGTRPKGICGISIINLTTAFACGRYFCPANAIKTTDAGISWVSYRPDTSLASSLVDCYFWSLDSGIAVGGYSPVNQFYSGKSVVLKTVNGGVNWTREYISSRNNEWCWKINFMNAQTGFVSIERGSSGNVYYLKTTDKGNSWQEQLFVANYDVEGIGFLNETTGWIGGWGFNENGPTYETTNAGANWHLAGWGINMNRIRFISDTLAYAVGQTVYKYTSEPIGIQSISTEVPKQFSLAQNYPNPFNPETKIKFSIPAPLNPPEGGKFSANPAGSGRNVRLIIYDVLGRQVATLVNEQLNPGAYEVTWDAANYPSGVYFYRLESYPSARSERSDGYTESKKMLLVK